MNIKLSKEVLEIAEFLQTQSESLKYGKITVELTFHSGSLKYIDKSVSIKTMIEGK